VKEREEIEEKKKWNHHNKAQISSCQNADAASQQFDNAKINTSLCNLLD